MNSHIAQTFKKYPMASGVLAPLSALPSSYGIGDMGPQAYEWVDVLNENSQTYWQLLPISFADKVGCPYASSSAFGYYPLLISPDLLKEEGLLNEDELTELSSQMTIEDQNFVNYDKVTELKNSIFKKAYQRFQDLDKDHSLKKSMKEFAKKAKFWLPDFSEFLALREEYGLNWSSWPPKYAQRDKEALDEFNRTHKDKIEFQKFLQFVFYNQWQKLKSYAESKKIRLIGDIPIFVAYSSSDVWAQRKNFKLTQKGLMEFETGAPPDAFSDEGQKWNTPNYNWEQLKSSDYLWWHQRLQFMFEHFHVVRLDHFIGMYHVWEVPVSSESAASGSRTRSKGDEFLKNWKLKNPDLPLIVEDLGEMEKPIIELREELGFPGMRILQFGFGTNDENEHLKKNIPENTFTYTGTHDNSTIQGWAKGLREQENSEDLEKVKKYFNVNDNDFSNFHWSLIAEAMSTESHTVILPVQDILGLDDQARFNIPGTKENNWKWRFQLSDELKLNFNKLNQMTIESKRVNHVFE